MGAKPSKSSSDDHHQQHRLSTRSFNINNKKRKSHNLRAVLSPSSSNTTTAEMNNNKQTEQQLLLQQQQQQQQNNVVSRKPSSCTTIKAQAQSTLEPALTAPIITTATTAAVKQRSSPPPPPSSSHYDPLKSASSSKKQPRRKNSPSSVKHLSMASNSNNSGDSAFYSLNKSNMSSGWTTLSNDPFSQIEAANTSAFTEITDQSTISRKSFYPAAAAIGVESSTLSLLAQPPCYSQQQPTDDNNLLHAMTAQDILNQLNTSTTSSYSIIKEAYKIAQLQNDPYDWNQFYLAMEQYCKNSTDSIGIVYLARCLISGLGTTINIERGIELLKSNPSCETTYALGHCYLDGFAATGENKKFETAFQCFSTVVQQYSADLSNESIQSTVAEAQCTLARMLFQGQGVQQNTTEALNLLLQSAENNNM
jgi:hypothetical protein